MFIYDCWHICKIILIKKDYQKIWFSSINKMYKTHHHVIMLYWCLICTSCAFHLEWNHLAFLLESYFGFKSDSFPHPGTLMRWTKGVNISPVNPPPLYCIPGVLYEAASAHVGISFEADIWPSLNARHTVLVKAGCSFIYVKFQNRLWQNHQTLEIT